MSSKSISEVDDVSKTHVLDIKSITTGQSMYEAEIPVLENDNSVESQNSLSADDEMIETCVIDGSEIHCAVNDDDSNIGSMVSIQSEDVLHEEGSVSVHSGDVMDDKASVESIHSEEIVDDDAEFIIPEVLPNKEQQEKQIQPSPPKVLEIPKKTNAPQSWPTLEILPGGVINPVDKSETAITPIETEDTESSLMYACAKCPQSFKYLFCLVKHVRWHEEVEKTEKYRKEREKADSRPEWLVKKLEEIEKKKLKEGDLRNLRKGLAKGAKKVAILKPVKTVEYQTLVKDSLVCLKNGKITLVPKVKKPKKS